MTSDEGASDAVSFELHVQELFSDRDQEAMLIMFDLWDLDDVRDNADAILEQVASGRMPCYADWPEDRVALFRRWIEQGKPE